MHGLKAISRLSQRANKRKNLGMQEIVVKFVYSRQQKMKNFSS